MLLHPLLISSVPSHPRTSPAPSSVKEAERSSRKRLDSSETESENASSGSFAGWMSRIPEASRIIAAIHLPPTTLQKPTEDVFALALWCLNCVFYVCFPSLGARLTVLLGPLSRREGNARLALNSAPDLTTGPGQSDFPFARSLVETLYFLTPTALKPFDFFFSFCSLSVIDDQGGEVCDSHFPLQYSHPVSKI